MTAYYNENDDYAAAWLENLIAAGHIAPGVVDRRPIQDVEAFELMEFTQCHFFAGIGVWSHALRRAGWSDDRPIWTGSCPCQPFSAAGKQKGFEDERHLWPIWDKLIEQRKPPVVVGEQVDKALDWIDLVSSDLEAQNYAFGAAIISAAGFKGAHIRHRNYFVGLQHSKSDGWQQRWSEPGERSPIVRRGNDGLANSTSCGCSWPCRCGEKQGQRIAERGLLGGLVDNNNNNTGSQGRQGMPECTDQLLVRQTGMVDRLADADGGNAGTERQQSSGQYGFEPESDGSHGLADTECDGRNGGGPIRSGRWSKLTNGSERIEFQPTNAPMLGRTPVDWLYGRDGKWRPVAPSIQPLAYAYPCGMGRLRTDHVDSCEAEIKQYAKTFSRDPTTDMFSLWESLPSTDFSKWSSGADNCVYETEILFAFMLKLASEGRCFSEGIPCAGKEIEEGKMLLLWNSQKTARSSYRRGLDEQLTEQFADPLHILSSILVRYAQKAWEEAKRIYAEPSFPLGKNAVSRVGRLRAYGNALDAETATQFCEVVREICDGI